MVPVPTVHVGSVAFGRVCPRHAALCSLLVAIGRAVGGRDRGTAVLRGSLGRRSTVAVPRQADDASGRPWVAVSVPLSAMDRENGQLL